MNKITIPALLLGVVMIAGAFAFMPVQEASTVHTTASGAATQIKTITSASVAGAVLEGGTSTTLTCNGECIVLAIKATIVTGDGDEEVNISADTITVDGTVQNHEIFNMTAGADLADDNLLTSATGVNNISDGMSGSGPQFFAVQSALVIPWTDIAGTFDADDSLVVEFIIEQAADNAVATAVTAG